jgi:CRP-like cAMP-binding protein
MASESFVGNLNEECRKALEERWTVRRYARKEMVIAHEEESRDVFFVLAGQARATIYSEGGVAVAYRDIGPGGIFGELSAIDGRPRSASVMAVEPLRVARLSETAFRELVNSRSDFNWSLLTHLASQVRRLTDRVYEFSTLVIRKRLIRELLRLAKESDRGEEEALIEHPPTQAELAARISTHREAVSREMSDLVKGGLIDRRGDALVLRDLATLNLMCRDTE